MKRKEETDKRSSEAEPTITSLRDIVFDYKSLIGKRHNRSIRAIHLSMFYILIAFNQSDADKWVTDRDQINRVHRCFLWYGKKPIPKNRLLR